MECCFWRKRDAEVAKRLSAGGAGSEDLGAPLLVLFGADGDGYRRGGVEVEGIGGRGGGGGSGRPRGIGGLHDGGDCECGDGAGAGAVGGDGLDGREGQGWFEDGSYGGDGCKLYSATVVSTWRRKNEQTKKRQQTEPRLPFPLPFFNPLPPPSSASNPPGPRLFDLDFLEGFAGAGAGLVVGSVACAELVGMTAMLLRERRGRGWGSLDDIVDVASWVRKASSSFQVGLCISQFLVVVVLSWVVIRMWVGCWGVGEVAIGLLLFSFPIRQSVAALDEMGARVRVGVPDNAPAVCCLLWG